MITYTIKIPINSQKLSQQVTAFATDPLDQGELAQLGLTDVSAAPPGNVSVGASDITRTFLLTPSAQFLLDNPTLEAQHAAIASLFRQASEITLTTSVLAETVV